jgi:alpha-beta hydrolase superfamily lysophospholipase
MEAMERVLPDIVVPTLVAQSSKDPVVDPSSAMDIFAKVGTPLKELTLFERENHGIVNGPRSEEVFERVYRFLLWAQEQRPHATLRLADENMPKGPTTRDSLIQETAS